jgi:hypothetical protein
MRNQHHNLYRPGFAEDQIPSRFRWIDDVVPWACFFAGVCILGATVWRIV